MPRVIVPGFKGHLDKPKSGINEAGRGRPRKVGAATFHTISKPQGTEIFSLSLYQVDPRLQQLGATLDPSPTLPSFQSPTISTPAQQTLSGSSIEDIQIALQTKDRLDPARKLPSYYYHHLPVFNFKGTDTLPHHPKCDHRIELKPNTTPTHCQLYNMSIEELQVLRKYLNEQLEEGFVRASKSPAAAPVLCAQKAGGGLRFCVDYRGLNAITIKIRYSLPLVQETLSRLSNAKYYTKLDIIAAFNYIRVVKVQEWMTAFNTRYGLVETLVMPFGLSNAPATFQARINEVLRLYLDIFFTAYIDDILIYSENLPTHQTLVNTVFHALGKAGLHCDIKKCEFEVTKVTHLGLIISTTGISIDP
ncbi:hypothetical protein K3495_g995 [Podosphaera aphanis]|nr:hypothetical protein K3495_g995 [Podosphaera aphanis]